MKGSDLILVEINNSWNKKADKIAEKLEELDVGSVNCSSYKNYSDVIENRLDYLKRLINNDEEFNILLDILRYKVKKEFEWKWFYSKKDVADFLNVCIGQEILKRS